MMKKTTRRSFLKDSAAVSLTGSVFAGLINTPGVANANGYYGMTGSGGGTTVPDTTKPRTTNGPEPRDKKIVDKKWVYFGPYASEAAATAKVANYPEEDFGNTPPGIPVENRSFRTEWFKILVTGAKDKLPSSTVTYERSAGVVYKGTNNLWYVACLYTITTTNNWDAEVANSTTKSTNLVECPASPPAYPATNP